MNSIQIGTNNGIEFSYWLKEQRRVSSLTQKELADLIGCSTITVVKLEAGERRPSKQVAKLLAEHLGVGPDEYSRFVAFARVNPLCDEEASLAQSAAQAPWREVRRSDNLPVYPTSYIGREELTEAAGNLLLRPGVRLLNLVGPPGVGKTRLGLQVAGGIAGHFSDGAFFVSLADIEDPTLVAQAVARTLGLFVENGASAVDELKRCLHNKQILLVLDNFEHLLPAAFLPAELMRVAPYLKLLVTSRAVLHIYGEHIFRVPPMSIPDCKQLPTIEQLAQCEAVALFTERAQAATADFRLKDENARTIAAICARLEGLPLAIELAAARTQHLSLEAVHASGNATQSHAARLQDLPARHQTLRDAIAWSYNLLSREEQVIFRCMSALEGYHPLAIIMAVCKPEEASETNVLRLLCGLVDKSLLQQRVSSRGEMCFGMLETLRDYAGELEKE